MSKIKQMVDSMDPEAAASEIALIWKRNLTSQLINHLTISVFVAVFCLTKESVYFSIQLINYSTNL